MLLSVRTVHYAIVTYFSHIPAEMSEPSFRELAKQLHYFFSPTLATILHGQQHCFCCLFAHNFHQISTGHSNCSCPPMNKAVMAYGQVGFFFGRPMPSSPLPMAPSPSVPVAIIDWTFPRGPSILSSSPCLLLFPYLAMDSQMAG